MWGGHNHLALLKWVKTVCLIKYVVMLEDTTLHGDSDDIIYRII